MYISCSMITKLCTRSFTSLFYQVLSCACANVLVCVRLCVQWMHRWTQTMWDNGKISISLKWLCYATTTLLYIDQNVFGARVPISLVTNIKMMRWGNQKKERSERIHQAHERINKHGKRISPELIVPTRVFRPTEKKKTKVRLRFDPNLCVWFVSFRFVSFRFRSPFHP